jgi:WXG100 family type VII secretion target
MAATAAKFDEVNDQLQGMLRLLMTQLSGLSSTWKGAGALAFEDVKTRYEADLKKLNQALSETAEAIRQSGRSYAAADAEAASRVSSTGGNLSLPL